MKKITLAVTSMLVMSCCTKQQSGSTISVQAFKNSPISTAVTTHIVEYSLTADITDTFEYYYTTDTGYVRGNVIGSINATIRTDSLLLTDIGVEEVNIPAGNSYELRIKVDGVSCINWIISDTHNHCVTYRIH